MAVEAIGCSEYREIVGGVGHLLAVEVNERTFGVFRSGHANVVGCHERVVGSEEIIVPVVGIVDYFRSLEVVFLIIGTSGHQMTLVALGEGKPGGGVEFKAEKTAEV